jgi:hypothetical protein
VGEASSRVRQTIEYSTQLHDHQLHVEDMR